MMNSHIHSTCFSQLHSYRQQGSVLLISLMILLAMTFITFSSSQSVLVQEKLAAASKENMRVFEAAEQALLAGEAWVTANAANPALFSTGGGANGTFDGTACDATIANCYVNRLQDVYDPLVWNNSAPAPVLLMGGVTDGRNYNSTPVNSQYIVVNLGPANFAIPSADGVSESGAGGIVTNAYQDPNADSAAAGGATNSTLFKIYARAVSPSGVQKILVSHYAVAAGGNGGAGNPTGNP